MVDAPRLYRVDVDGMNVTSHVINLQIQKVRERAVGDATIIFSKSLEDAVPTDETLTGSSVVIRRGINDATERYVFRGEVVEVSPEGRLIEVHCKDKYYAAVRSEVTKSFDRNIDPEGGVISEIFKTLINDHTDGELVADDDSVTNSGSTFLLDKFVANHADTFERADELAETLDWQHYYDDEEDKVFFEPFGEVPLGYSLVVGENVVRVPKWRINKEELINDLTVIGAEKGVETTEFFDGDASEDEFILQYTPTSMKVYVGSGSFDPDGSGTKPSDNNANLQQGGKEGSTSGDYNYEYDDDPEVRAVTFEDGSVPASGVNNVEIQYTHQLPAPVTGTDPASIAAFKRHKKTFTKTELQTIHDAELYLQTKLAWHAFPITSTMLRVVDANNLRIGRVAVVEDSVNNIFTEVVISRIVMRYPYQYDEVHVGREPFRETDWRLRAEDRIKRLEEQFGKSQDLLLHVINLERTARHRRRDAVLEKRSFSGPGHDAFVFGHPELGVIGVKPLGADPEPAWSTVRVVQGNNLFKELIVDNDYHDTINSVTTTWSDETDYTGSVSIAAGGTLETTFITLGVTYAAARLTLSNITTTDPGTPVAASTLELYVSADGKSTWQEVPHNTLTTLTTTNNDGVAVRVHNPTAGAVVLRNQLHPSTNDVQEPAIKLQLQE